jgi:hypothetical protein
VPSPTSFRAFKNATHGAIEVTSSQLNLICNRRVAPELRAIHISNVQP